MHTPVSPRVSARANKGKTSRYDDFVQQITAKVQQITQQVQQIANTYNLDENNNNQTWTANPAYIQYLPIDRQMHQTLLMPNTYHQNYGYLNNGVYTNYGDFRPPEVWRGGAA